MQRKFFTSIGTGTCIHYLETNTLGVFCAEPEQASFSIVLYIRQHWTRSPHQGQLLVEIVQLK